MEAELWTWLSLKTRFISSSFTSYPYELISFLKPCLSIFPSSLLYFPNNSLRFLLFSLFLKKVCFSSLSLCKFTYFPLNSSFIDWISPLSLLLRFKGYFNSYIFCSYCFWSLIYCLVNLLLSNSWWCPFSDSLYIWLKFSWLEYERYLGASLPNVICAVFEAFYWVG